MRRAKANSRAWDYLTELNPDLALLQEVGDVPPHVRDTYAVCLEHPAGKKGGVQRFHTGILARGNIGEAIPLMSAWSWVNNELARFASNLVARYVTLADGTSLRAMSVYSPAWPVDRTRLIGCDVSEVKLTENPHVWVTELLWAAMRYEGPASSPPWIIGGDLNSSPTFDDLWPHGPHGNREILARMVALGFTECLAKANGALVPSFRNPRGGKIIHQMDHLFVQGSLMAPLESCAVGDQDRVFGGSLSDHLPIIAQFGAAAPQ